MESQAMQFKEWDGIPEFMQNEDVKKYYEEGSHLI